MSNYSAQGSITIKRLRNGDTIFLTLELNGKPLFQAVDEQTGQVVPDWTVEANRPVITPHASTTRGNTVTLGYHTWKHNGVTLVFNGATVGSYIMDSTGKFGIDNTNGALKIFANLASAQNIANDTLTYECVATVAGVEYNLTKSVDVQIQKGGASSYVGLLIASTTQLSSTVVQATIQTQLWLSTAQVQSYYVKWYKDEAEWTAKAGQSQIIVTRDDIAGSQLFIAEFYANSGDQDFVARAGITIIDTADEIIVVPYISSQVKEVDEGQNVTVKARVVRLKDNTVLSPSNPTWLFQAMDGKTWTERKRSTTDSIVITTNETDIENESGNMEYHDMEVLVEVEFDSLTS